MRFYAQNSEYPRVIDRRHGKCVWTAPAYGYDQAKYTAEAMNRSWERDVEFVAAWLDAKAESARGPFGLEVFEGIGDTWRKEMSGE